MEAYKDFPTGRPQVSIPSRSLLLDGLRQSGWQAALLAFPVLGPVIVPLTVQGQRLTAAQSHAHVTVASLVNYFRVAFLRRRDVFLRQGQHRIVLAGPGIPAFCVAVDLAPPIQLQQAAIFFFGTRDIFRTALHVAGASIFAALPAGGHGCTWVQPVGCGLDLLQGYPEGTTIRTHPALDGAVLNNRDNFTTILKYRMWDVLRWTGL